MYPDLSYILHHLIGTDVDNVFSIVKTFGLFLAFAFIVAALFLASEFKRKEEEGLLKAVTTKVIVGAPASPWELLSSGLTGFLLGFKVLYIVTNFPEFQADAASVILSAKGSLLGGILGAIILAGLRYWEKDKAKLDKPVEKTLKVHPYERVGDVTIVAAISGIIGAKVFALIEDLPAFFADPLGTFFSGSGMAIYGGLIGAFIVVYFYVKKIGLKPIHVMDAVAPSLIIAYGIGRLGCHFSGDGDWGIVNTLAQPSWFFLPDWIWSFDYPHNVINEGVNIAGCDWDYCQKLPAGVFPTSIYETTVSFLFGGILWMLRKRIKIAGLLFFIYVIFNGVERFFIEKIRVNDRYDIMGMQSTQAEFIAVILIIIGIVGCLFLWQRHKKNPVAA
ncbi:MAG: prolipoprotein diacylglyceryl transferase [Saprospiraceae bacterium]